MKIMAFSFEGFTPKFIFTYFLSDLYFTVINLNIKDSGALFRPFISPYWMKALPPKLSPSNRSFITPLFIV
jgi:hypothetical protein